MKIGILTIKIGNDMYTQDKILRGGEITAQGTFTRDGLPFYVFLMPKEDMEATPAVLTVRLPYNREETAFPFQPGIWNPVAVTSLDVEASDLTSYRIFWGSEK